MSDNGDQRRASRALDAANFFLADVRDGLGPYLAVYLLTEQHWDEARIGLVMSIATVAGVVAQTPAGALVDATRAKRTVMALAAIVVTLASCRCRCFPPSGRLRSRRTRAGRRRDLSAGDRRRVARHLRPCCLHPADRPQ